MRCPGCGAEIPNRSDRCLSCGAHPLAGKPGHAERSAGNMALSVVDVELARKKVARATGNDDLVSAGVAD
jgi:hypothetical protein